MAFEREHKPRLQDKVWVEARHLKGKQPNGVIFDIKWHDEEIHVKFGDGYADSFSFDEFEGNWSDKFGGTYLIHAT